MRHEDYDIEGYYETKGCMFILLGILVTTLIVIIGIIVERCVNDEEPNPPIEEINVIDSLNKVNERIDSNIIKLDSIKQNEIEKVKNYSNDSTLELFKELVSE